VKPIVGMMISRLHKQAAKGTLCDFLNHHTELVHTGARNWVRNDTAKSALLEISPRRSTTTSARSQTVFSESEI